MTGEAPKVAADSLLAGAVTLLQPVKGHRAGTDAVLLAAAAAPLAKGILIDAGAASGAVGLMALRRNPGTEAIFIEQDAFLTELCRRNIATNGLANARAVTADILNAKVLATQGISGGIADMLVTNPPFLDPARARLSPDAGRTAAHALTNGTLADWIAACARLLKTKGLLHLIHRADRLDDVLASLSNGFGSIRIRAIHPRAEEMAIRIVVRAIKGGKGPLGIDPPLILHDATGCFTPEAAALHNGSQTGLFERMKIKT